MKIPFAHNLKVSDLNLSRSGAGVRLGDLNIAGVPFYVMFIEVNKQCEAVGEGQSLIDAIAEADEGDDYQVVMHKGKRYFVVIHPHQA